MDEIDAIDSTEKPPSRLKNTFAPYCENEYFTPATLTGLCRYGFPYEQLPKEGKQMVDDYMSTPKGAATATGAESPNPRLEE